MPFESGPVVVRRLDDEWWAVVEPLVYHGARDRFVVPAGFPTDFATVPRVVVWLVPRFGRYTAAAILHDWLCTVGIASGAVTAREADGLFRRVMRESGVPVVRRWLMWCAVRWGAFGDPVRGAGWWRSAPGVLAISLLAAPVVLPPALVITVALAVYGAVEAAVGLVTGSRPEDVTSFRT
ncbi:DUF1353 domain-containing protein [Blastococcus xanthinilyticus]|uniref:Uncharacterized protein DUF1353 n=1 Tax=Blastococcus xanthinilyticus TaxID=1564164 RepID=A0A5S5CXK4_9ACTN|nr:DUF1353 domain-containing protein [Blastococcus xanthinilyticus]TYP88453.1 uncharacterized protein DUF1353 [Blastococcus xanthinilyticus]